MKILAINLLRLGDVIMNTAAISRLKKRYPKSEVHFLINSQNKMLEPMLVDVDKVWGFDRNEIQASLGSYSSPYLEAYYRINKLVEKINGEKFDLIINLTQNFLSSYLVSILRAKEKWGMVSDLEGNIELTNDWFRKLNVETQKMGLHYVDLLGRAVDEGVYSTPLILKTTERGEYAANQLLGNNSGHIVLQPLTSDAKKNWGLNNFAELTIELADKIRNQKFIWLGSSAEAEQLEPVYQEMLKMGIPVQLAICDLECALSILKRSRLLITGDTAIKHMAAAVGTKILEVAIGSSDFVFTGAYLADCMIVTSRQPCAPCHHRLPCSREKHHCALDIKANVLSEIAKHWILQNDIYKSAQVKFEVYKTLFTPSQEWRAVKVGEKGTNYESVKFDGNQHL